MHNPPFGQNGLAETLKALPRRSSPVRQARTSFEVLCLLLLLRVPSRRRLSRQASGEQGLPVFAFLFFLHPTFFFPGDRLPRPRPVALADARCETIITIRFRLVLFRVERGGSSLRSRLCVGLPFRTNLMKSASAELRRLVREPNASQWFAVEP